MNCNGGWTPKNPETMNEASWLPWLSTLAGALVHSLWVFGLWISLAYGLSRFSGTARGRYRVYLIALGGLPVLFGGLLFLAGPSSITAISDGVAELMIVADLDRPMDAEVAAAPPLRPSWLPYLGVVYLLGLLLSGLRSTLDYRRGRALRQRALPPPAKERRRFERLRDRFGRSRGVRWLISSRVDSVMVLGFLRPVILFPVGLLAQLSVTEVEAVLLHELAHLRRNDHRWVVVQRLVRDLFYFHPLVHWLCRQLDRERELACDDLVVAGGTVSSADYAQTLLRVARYSESLYENSPAMALRATSSPFGYRLKRLLSTSTPSARPGGRYPYLLVLLLVCGGWVLGRAGTGELTVPSVVEAVKPDQGVVSGRVLDGATLKPLIGANVVVVVDGETLGTVTDFEGRYALRVPLGERRLQFTYIGYTTTVRTVIVDEATQVDVVMDKEGSPAADGPSPTSIRITGEGSDSPRGNILYIVDGKRMDGDDPVAKLDPQSIEGIEVFKEPADIERFGYGTNFEGVVVITLKKE
jgi:beta-lactamase regulating signal transducer with metallopeptidase domain